MSFSATLNSKVTRSSISPRADAAGETVEHRPVSKEEVLASSWFPRFRSTVCEFLGGTAAPRNRHWQRGRRCDRPGPQLPRVASRHREQRAPAKQARTFRSKRLFATCPTGSLVLGPGMFGTILGLFLSRRTALTGPRRAGDCQTHLSECDTATMLLAAKAGPPGSSPEPFLPRNSPCVSSISPGTVNDSPALLP